jgi:hypothetical protein
VAWHTTPHPPQLFGSVSSFTQILLHTASPAEQVQIPAAHSPPPGHTFSQAPQKFGSVCSSMQTLPQAVIPLGHGAQIPFW